MGESHRIVVNNRPTEGDIVSENPGEPNVVVDKDATSDQNSETIEDANTQEPEPPAITIDPSTEATIPDKFRSEDGTINQEALLKSYLELEKERSRKLNTQSDNQDPQDVNDQTLAPMTQNESDQLFDDFTANGTLTDVQFDRVKGTLTKEHIHQYMSLLGSDRAAQESGLRQSIGGDEYYAAMAEWARSELSKVELTAFNSSVSSTDLTMAQQAVQGMFARYKEANPQGPQRRVVGSKFSSDDPDIYHSTAEMHADMLTQKYKRGDPATLNKVADKLKRSNI